MTNQDLFLHGSVVHPSQQFLVFDSVEVSFLNRIGVEKKCQACHLYDLER
jgi:hypothetical protein